MKNNETGFSVAIALLLLITFGLIGAVGWLVYDRQNNKTVEEQANTTQTNTKSTPSKEDDSIPEGFTKYSNQTLGISFIYPSIWGEVEKTEFDQEGNSEYFELTKFEGLTMGGLQKDYESPGRGGSLIDYGGFIKEGNGFKFRSHIDKSAEGNAEGYKLNTSGVCILSTNENFFEEPAFHAVCNLNNNDAFGFNFAAYNTSSIKIDDFLKVVNSVSIR